MNNTVIYARDEHSDSLHDQVYLLREYCALKGIVYSDIVWEVSNGIGVKIPSRKPLSLLLQRVLRKEVNHIVVRDLYRLSVNQSNLKEIIDILKRNQVKLTSMYSFDLANEMDLLE